MAGTGGFLSGSRVQEVRLEQRLYALIDGAKELIPPSLEGRHEFLRALGLGSKIDSMKFRNCNGTDWLSESMFLTEVARSLEHEYGGESVKKVEEYLRSLGWSELKAPSRGWPFDSMKDA